MKSLHAILKRARRRLALDGALQDAAAGAAVGITVGLLAVVIDRLTPLTTPMWLPGALAGAGLLLGAARGWLRTPPLATVAVRLDETLHLRDRLGTGEAIDRGFSGTTDAGFAAFARRDAERFASRLDVRSATPVHLTRRWIVTVVALVALIGVWWFMPPMAWGTPDEPELNPQEQVALADARRDAVRTIDEVLDDLAQSANATSAADDADRQALEDLAQQMRGSPPDDAESFAQQRDEAATRMNDLARRMEAQAEADRRTADQLAEQFSRLDQQSGANENQSPFTDQLEEALRQGEYDRAADALDELNRTLDSMSEAERRQLAEEVRNLGEQTRQSSDQSRDSLEQRESELREALREQGVDQEAIDKILNDRQPSSDPTSDTANQQPPQQEDARDEVKQQLRDRGVDEEFAEKIADDVQQQREQRQASEEAQRDAQKMRETLERMSRDIEERQPESTDGQQPNQPPQDPENPAETGEQNDRQMDPQQQGNEDQPTQQQGNETEQSQAQQEQGEPQQNQQTQQTQPGGQQQQQSADATGQQDEPQNRQIDPGEPGAENQQTQRQGESTDQTDPAPQQEQGQPAGSDQDQTQDPQLPDKLPSANEMRELMKQWQQREQSAEQNEQQARRMRERAKEMLDKMTPDERRRLEEWAQQMQRELQKDASPNPPSDGQGGDSLDGMADPSSDAPSEPIVPGDEAVDLRERQPANDQRTMAEWLADERGEVDPSRSNRPSSSQAVGEARRSAEQAVNESAVPSRYHNLIRRYFDRLSKTVDTARETGNEGGPPGEREE